MTVEELFAKLTEAIDKRQEERRVKILADCKEQCPTEVARAKNRIAEFTAKKFSLYDSDKQVVETGHSTFCLAHKADEASQLDFERLLRSMVLGLEAPTLMGSDLRVTFCYQCGVLMQARDNGLNMSQFGAQAGQCPVCHITQALREMRININL